MSAAEDFGYATSRRDPQRELAFKGRVTAADTRRVAVSGIAPQPVACEWSDDFGVLVRTGKALGRRVLVVLASGQPVIVCAIDEGA